MDICTVQGSVKLKKQGKDFVHLLLDFLTSGEFCRGRLSLRNDVAKMNTCVL